MISGRLRSTARRRNGGFNIIGEHGRGESIGELEVIGDSLRPVTLHAIRDTELARMPRSFFLALTAKHPSVMVRVSQLIASRSRGVMFGSEGEKLLASVSATQPTPTTTLSTKGDKKAVAVTAIPDPADATGFPAFNESHIPIDYAKSNANLRTVGIIPICANVPLMEFAERLRDALERLSGVSTILLNNVTVLNVMGRHAFSRMGKFKLNNWLTDQEEKYRIVLYVADGGMNAPWTQSCIRQVGSSMRTLKLQ